MVAARRFAVNLLMLAGISPSVWTHCVGEQPEQNQPNRPARHRLSILGPTKSGVRPRRVDPPTLGEVLRASTDTPAFARTADWLRKHEGRLEVMEEVIADYVDPPRVVPWLGPAQLHHVHYRVTISAEDDGSVEVVTVDHSHYYMIPTVTIRSGPASSHASNVDDRLESVLTQWNHSVLFFGNVNVAQLSEQVIAKAENVKLSVQLKRSVMLKAEGRELSMRFTPNRSFQGTVRGKVRANLGAELLHCDSLKFSSDGRVNATGSVRFCDADETTVGQLQLDGKPLSVARETVLERLTNGKSPIVDFIADEFELDLKRNTVTVRPAAGRSQAQRWPSVMSQED